MNGLLAWLADVILGPPCPIPPRCWYRGRGKRSLDKHVARDHPGWDPCC